MDHLEIDHSVKGTCGRSEVALACREFGRVVALGRSLRALPDGDDDTKVAPVLWKADLRIKPRDPQCGERAAGQCNDVGSVDSSSDSDSDL